MIRLRKECPEIGWGDWKILQTNCPTVLVMQYTWKGDSLITIHNFDERPHDVRFKPDAPSRQQLFDLVIDRRLEPGKSGSYKIVLEPYGYHWLRIGGLDYGTSRQLK